MMRGIWTLQHPLLVNNAWTVNSMCEEQYQWANMLYGKSYEFRIPESDFKHCLWPCLNSYDSCYLHRKTANQLSFVTSNISIHDGKQYMPVKVWGSAAYNREDGFHPQRKNRTEPEPHFFQWLEIRTML